MSAPLRQRQTPSGAYRPIKQASDALSDSSSRGHEYDEIRLQFQRVLGTARINMQVGASFRDVVSPGLGELNSGKRPYE